MNDIQVGDRVISKVFGPDFLFTVQSVARDAKTGVERFILRMQLNGECVKVSNFGPVRKFEERFCQTIAASREDLMMVSVFNLNIEGRLRRLEERVPTMERMLALYNARVSQLEADAKLQAARQTATEEAVHMLQRQLGNTALDVEEHGRQLGRHAVAHDELKQFVEEYAYAVTPVGDAGSVGPADVFFSQEAALCWAGKGGGEDPEAMMGLFTESHD